MKPSGALGNHVRTYASALFLCLPLLAVAQSDPALVPDKANPMRNYVGHIRVIHAERPSHSFAMNTITLDVIVSPDGRVEYAHAIQGPGEFFAEAEAIEKSRLFTPFQKDGKAIRASITDYVWIVPAEQWGAKEPFPKVTDWSSLRFSLERPPWYCEDCPAYSLEIRGDGAVVFQGVHPDLISGTYRGTIPKELVSELLERFRQADYFSLREKYVMDATDMETVKMSLTVGGTTKTVTDYGGLEKGMPEVVLGLEAALDQAAVAAFRSVGLSRQADLLEAAISSRHY